MATENFLRLFHCLTFLLEFLIHFIPGSHEFGLCLCFLSDEALLFRLVASFFIAIVSDRPPYALDFLLRISLFSCVFYRAFKVSVD